MRIVLDTSNMTVQDFARYLRARNVGDYEGMARVLDKFIAGGLNKKHWTAFYDAVQVMESEISGYIQDAFGEGARDVDEEELVEGFLNVIQKAGQKRYGSLNQSDV